MIVNGIEQPETLHSTGTRKAKSSDTVSHGFRPQADELDRLLSLVDRGEPTIVVGPTGCGKTTLIESVADKLGLPLITVVGGRIKCVEDLLGRLRLHAGESVFKDGPLLTAAKQGTLFYFDELHDAREDALSCLKSLTDHRRFIEVDGVRYPPTTGFCFIASYVPPARNLGPELRQRCEFVALGYLPPDQERALLIDATGIAVDDAQFLIQVGQVIRKQLGGVLPAGIGTRVLLKAAARMREWRLTREAVVEQILWKLADKTEDTDLCIHQTALQSLRSAGLFSIEELRRLRLSDAVAPEGSTQDDDFFEANDHADDESPAGKLPSKTRDKQAPRRKKA